MNRIRTFLFCLIAFIAAVPAFADDISKISPTSYVTDLAGVIPAATKQRLETLSTELQQKTGAQLAVITIRSLDDRPVEDFAVELFHRLGIGQKGQNNGVLLLLAPNDRKYRIEVGYGLEPIINDARAGDAGRAMVPFLRQNDYGSAVELAAWQLAKYIADDKGVTLSGQPPARPVAAPRSNHNNSPLPLFFIFFFIFVVFMVLRASARASASIRTGGCGDGCLWLIPLLASGGGSGRGSNWGGGGFGGGGGGGGGGGFGGFGGGSSGGGGASGSW